MELGWHFDKHSPTTRERKVPQGKKSQFFCLETLKNCILNEKLYPYMTKIRTFSPKIGALFSDFQKRQRRPPPPFPPSLRAWINNLNELLRKYFLLFKSIAKQTARSTFIQLTFIQSFIHQASYFIISV